ncbi:hypothetical protein BDB00DRAFT_872013 [Zychaea mexicana]|uniref:uncharacterized protein n=1 Tax=Zychaea mexicana TaxID=64656 RepID=UPI0022FF041D|nr:uncharacterized protein BDB00DRAFT_872013 [Zychaea mexicana]KAI9493770.1 hypothetical protein BDB00DRAFT_872013 [Zychaea mexicana]
MLDNKQLKFDAYSLDEWLENDLRASGILNEPAPIEKKRNNSSTTTSSVVATQCCNTGGCIADDAMHSSTLLQEETSKQRMEHGTQHPVTLKRQRNTDAARRSRLRKCQRMDSLETRMRNLELANEHLRLRAAVLESERKATLHRHKRSEERIMELDKQLAEAHEALVRRHQTT